MAMSKSRKKRIMRDKMWYGTGMVQAAEKAAKPKKPKIRKPKMPRVIRARSK